jgi:hypothetical protein
MKVLELGGTTLKASFGSTLTARFKGAGTLSILMGVASSRYEINECGVAEVVRVDVRGVVG